LSEFDLARVGLMAKNLVRFATWQNPLATPLLLLSTVPAFQARGVMRSLWLGLGLTVVAMYVILPYQGHGWGYRYLHGLLGSACLLGAWTWSRLTGALKPELRAAAGAVFAAAAILSVGLLLPIRAVQVHRFVQPYALADARIRQASAPLVLVDDRPSLYAVDLIRNDPFLAGDRHVMRLSALGEAQLRDLCARQTIAVFDRADAVRAGIRLMLHPQSDAPSSPRARFLQSARCGPWATPIRDLAGQPVD
jgi:hypothetical protein